MSMLSAQCDELRTMAESVGLSMPQVATLMMEAADTIWELRGMVHKERTENAKLRELVADVHESLRADKAGMFHKLILASMEDDMRELGIEVNE